MPFSNFHLFSTNNKNKIYRYIYYLEFFFFVLFLSRTLYEYDNIRTRILQKKIRKMAAMYVEKIKSVNFEWRRKSIENVSYILISEFSIIFSLIVFLTPSGFIGILCSVKCTPKKQREVCVHLKHRITRSGFFLS